MKKKSLLIAALSAILLLTACGGETNQEEKEAEAVEEAVEESASGETAADTDEAAESASTEKILVGVSLQNLSNEWIAMLKDALVEQAEGNYPEMELIILDGEGDAAKQIPQMEGFINQKCDVVLCNPQDGNMLIPAFQEVLDAGIPVIALGSDCEEQLGQVQIRIVFTFQIIL